MYLQNMRSTIFKSLLGVGLIISTLQAEEPEEVLSFWFGAKEYDPARNKIWFGGDDREFDREIQYKFEKAVLGASHGEFDHWKQSPKGASYQK